MIRSAANPRLKALRLLTAGKGKTKASQRAAVLLGLRSRMDDHPRMGLSDLLLLEGPHLVEAGVRRGLELAAVFATQTFIDHSHPILQRLLQPPTLVEHTLLNAMADADSPRGIVAVAKAPPSVSPEVLGDAWSTVLYLDRLSDPGNVGAILRVAEATSVDLVVFSPQTTSWRHPRALRASTGSAFRVPIAEGIDYTELDQSLTGKVRVAGQAALRPTRPAWYGLAADGEDLFSHPVSRQRVLAVGSEAGGLSLELAEHCTERISLPMAGELESLNVATAAAVALYELNRRS